MLSLKAARPLTMLGRDRLKRRPVLLDHVVYGQPVTRVPKWCGSAVAASLQAASPPRSQRFLGIDKRLSAGARGLKYLSKP